MSYGQLFVLSSIFGIASIACSPPKDSTIVPTKTKPTVYTTSFPVEYLVQRLAGELVDDSCILPIGEDAAFWKPSSDIVVQVQSGDAIISNGAGFESWMQTASLPSSKIVDSSRGIDLIHMQGQTHSHGKGGAHSHGETDPHTWSDPTIYLQQARNIHTALQRLLPNERSVLDENLAKLEKELQELATDYHDALVPLATVSFAANHPSFSYIMRANNIAIQNFVFEPEEKQSVEVMGKYTEWAKDKDMQVVLWEAEAHADAIADFDTTVIHQYIDPLEQPIDDHNPNTIDVYDYLEQSRMNIRRFRDLTQVIATRTANKEPTQENIAPQ